MQDLHSCEPYRQQIQSGFIVGFRSGCWLWLSCDKSIVNRDELRENTQQKPAAAELVMRQYGGSAGNHSTVQGVSTTSELEHAEGSDDSEALSTRYDKPVRCKYTERSSTCKTGHT
jgi:hypothetical protein